VPLVCLSSTCVGPRVNGRQINGRRQGESNELCGPGGSTVASYMGDCSKLVQYLESAP
jgi:hypothetical protein